MEWKVNNKLFNLYFYNFIDLKNVSNYIGTRNIGQVRSHLQKYLIKQKKLKEKAKKIVNEKKEESINNESNNKEEINLDEDEDNK